MTSLHEPGEFLLKSVLYIDDDADDLSIFGDALSAINKQINFISYLSGRVALDQLKRGGLSPDIIFIDLNMPQLNGFELLQELKKEKTLVTVPIIMFSTAKTQSNTRQAQVLGASAFIQKPNSYHELCDLLKELLAKGSFR